MHPVAEWGVMGELTASRFGEFYEAIHSHRPHPWQLRLAKDVVEGGHWPSSINIPTGCGKTSCIDIAVYALACNPAKNPRRIVFTVNRRVVVDGAHERATLIEDKLTHAQGGILLDVRDRLCSISGGGDSPLRSILLRGGTYIDKEWSSNPAQPCVISSTVDQAGSRLLFRGYGVGPLSRVVEAGLLGYDCLWVLDETHISRPFTETLRLVEKYRDEPWAKKRQDRPWHVVEMTATPVGGASPDFELDEDDRSSEVLARVLGARKKCDLVRSKAKDSGDHAALAADLVKRAQSLNTKFSCKKVAIVANRVATAKRAYDSLRKGGFKAHLLIGRMRPWDRDLILSRLDRFRTGSPKAAPGGNAQSGNESQQVTFVVSTQCLEVGADLDFDGMVSEASSFDSLRQRFGRLNRGGKHESCRGAIVAPTDVHKKGKKDSDGDPIYGHAAVKTWDFLVRDGRKQIDFGIDSISDELKKIPGDSSVIDGMHLEPPKCPELLPSHVDLLCQSQRHLHVSPDVAPFLHGFGRGVPTVSVVWRSGFRDGDPRGIRLDQYADFSATLDALPPRPVESMPVPLWSIRRYLETGRAGPDAGSDAEWQRRGDYSTGDVPGHDTAFPTAFIWRGKKDKSVLVQDEQMEKKLLDDLDAKNVADFKFAHVADIRPNDVVILSADDRGWDDLGHVPDSVGSGKTDENGGAEIDIAEKAAFASTSGLVLKSSTKCSQNTKRDSLYHIQGSLAIRMADDNGYLFPMIDEARRYRTAINNQEPRSSRNEILESVRESLPRIICQLAEMSRPDYGRDGMHNTSQVEAECDKGGHVDIDLKFMVCNMKVLQNNDVILKIWRRPDGGSSDVDRLLDEHMSSVAAAVERYAKALGLADDDLVKLLGTAALLHDAGKADGRFQQMLYRSLTPLPSNFPLRAKDNGLPLGKHKLHYPRGFRHELVSSRLAENIVVSDRDLLLHLIESHHGHCRPLAPPVGDRDAKPVEYKYRGDTLRTSPATGLEKVGSGASRRFWSCTRTYGWWGLAWIVALFLLADWDASRGSSQ